MKKTTLFCALSALLFSLSSFASDSPSVSNERSNACKIGTDGNCLPVSATVKPVSKENDAAVPDGDKAQGSIFDTQILKEYQNKKKLQEEEYARQMREFKVNTQQDKKEEGTLKIAVTDTRFNDTGEYTLSNVTVSGGKAGLEIGWIITGKAELLDKSEKFDTKGVATAVLKAEYDELKKGVGINAVQMEKPKEEKKELTVEVAPAEKAEQKNE